MVSRKVYHLGLHVVRSLQWFRWLKKKREFDVVAYDEFADNERSLTDWKINYWEWCSKHFPDHTVRSKQNLYSRTEIEIMMIEYCQ